ncbi:MFS transporter [Dactylosporangium cerinum]
MTRTIEPPVATSRHVNSTLLVVYLSLGGLAFAVLQSLVAPAMSTIARDLNASTADISWILTAYLLSASVLTPILGRLGDMVGKRRVLIAVLAVLAAGTLLAALAPNLAVLIVARAMQGAAGAILPLSIGIVRDELPREKVAVTVGLLSAIFGVGAGVGIVGAGPIVEHLSWHWLFWLPLVLVVIALLGAVFGMPESPVRTPAASTCSARRSCPCRWCRCCWRSARASPGAGATPRPSPCSPSASPPWSRSCWSSGA